MENGSAEREKTADPKPKVDTEKKAAVQTQTARKRPKYCDNFVRLQSKRQISDSVSISFQRKMLLNENFISRLGLETELQGHSGCVNCLEWNYSGDLLASGSDDCQIILWNPFARKKILALQSGHQGNIFSVKFLPNSNDATLVSGAADYKIHVHDINISETTMSCSCHGSRVKRLAVAPNLPFMFWSAAEDGLILQYDLRQPHRCSSTVNNVLINLISLMGHNAEAKCVTVNPLRPELLAVGANDPYVRLYDRRMLSTSSYTHRQEFYSASQWERMQNEGNQTEKRDFVIPASNLPSNCVKYFVAGHLPAKRLDYRKKFRTLACTYLAFSPQGNELLANLGGEQIYLFDILKPVRPKPFDVPLLTAKEPSISNGFCTKDGTLNVHSTCHPVKSKLPLHIDALRQKANEIFDRGHHISALELYNEAIQLCPNAAVLYGNRAAILMKRGWDGDLYCALRDCNKALSLDPDFFKAHFRLVRCLYELQWTKEAYDCFQLFKAKYPEHAKSPTCVTLERDITKALNASGESKSSNDACGCSSSKGARSSASFAASDEVVDSSGTGRHLPGIISDQERRWRSQANDFKQRFCGHCNTTTDIKEANFFGNYIIAGSDDGTFFTWDRETTNIVRILKGDDSIVNCLQPHPNCCLLATSGIDPVVRLWSPRPEDGNREVREVTDVQDQAQSNQRRMNMNPLETMLMNMGYRFPDSYDPDENDSDNTDSNLVQCRQS